MKLVLACTCLVALWALPMGKSGLATAADLIAIVGAGIWFAFVQEHA
jgi:hypothetical protein